MAKKAIRPIRIEGNVAYVPLTRGYEALIDAEDAAFVGLWNWKAHPTKHTVYATRTDISGPMPVTIRMHRTICPTSDHVDHINSDGLDNRKSNLRPATNAENSRNARLSKRNTSGVKGVSWNSSRSRWEASIRVDRQSKFLGRFTRLEDAAEAYRVACSVYHGDFGRPAGCAA